MKRSIPTLTAVVTLCMSWGCTRPEGDVTRLQFSVWGSVEQTAREQQIIDTFEGENPDIKIELLSIGGRYAEKIQSMMVGDIAPDIMMVEIKPYAEWASRGVLRDITDGMERLDNRSPILPVPRQAFIQNGKYFAAPVNCHGLVTFCNLDALDAAGIDVPIDGFSWEDLLEWAPKLSRRSGNPQAPTDYICLLPDNYILFSAFGAAAFDDPHNPTAVTINSPEALQALTFMRRMIEDRYAAPPEVSATQGRYQLFRDGKIALYFQGRWLTPNLDGIVDFTWDVAPVPEGPAGSRTLHGGTGIAVWSGTRHPEEAMRFLEFYASPKGAAFSMQYGRSAPIYRDLAYSDEFLSLRPPDHIIRFSETMEKGQSGRHVYAPGSQSALSRLEGRIQLAFSDPTIPSKVILDGMESDLNRWLTTYLERTP